MTRARGTAFAAAVLWSAVLLVNLLATGASPPQTASMFASPNDCLACHNNLTGPSGEDVSIGANWRGSIMANSARDPYVLASVRREMLDHPSAAGEIQHECSACHMPAAHQAAKAAGGQGRVFQDGSGDAGDPLMTMGRDGVSCTVCHQISAERLGTRESFNGNFAVASPLPDGRRRAFGPFAPNPGRIRIMHSVTGFAQERAAHVQQSELCATCHTLVTTARGADGAVLGSLPEQMPYQEWRHSAFDDERRSCQSCHMPRVTGPVRVASVLGEERPSLARHTFVGGNAFMLRLMNRYRDELGVDATSQELEATAKATVRLLEEETATVSIERATMAADALELDVAVRNLAGHKFPTGYPSRRAWLHVTVEDDRGRTVFESGRVNASGLIEGNDADARPDGFEPHYEQVTDPGQVQIYESIMGTVTGSPTTGLLQATQYLKDNRLLPRGFDKRSAGAEIAVHGGASSDQDFTGEGDRIRYRVRAPGAASIVVELRYQPIGYRWARNLASYKAAEPQAFVGYYDAVAADSSVAVARASVRVTTNPGRNLLRTNPTGGRR